MDWQRFDFTYTQAATQQEQKKELHWLLTEIEAHQRAVKNLILPADWQSSLNHMNRIRAIHGTTALEGNQLTEEQMQKHIHIDAAGRSDKDVRQVVNAANAMHWVTKRFGDGGEPLTVEDILHMHSLMTQKSDETDNTPGHFRQHDVTAGTVALGGVHRGAPYASLEALVEQFVLFLRSGKFRSESPVIQALLAHFFLITVHPFGDGNGRVSRLVEAAILYQGGYNVYGFYGLSNYFYRNRDKYIRLLQEGRRKQPFAVDSFVLFGLQGFVEELRGINEFIKAKTNCVFYRDMMTRALATSVGPRRRLLNVREYSLLTYLLSGAEPEKPFSEAPAKRLSLSELLVSSFVRVAYKDVTERAFWRELTRLAEVGFVTLTDEEDRRRRKVEVNFEAIGLELEG